jgi:hypothetical protein
MGSNLSDGSDSNGAISISLTVGSKASNSYPPVAITLGALSILGWFKNSQKLGNTFFAP